MGTVSVLKRLPEYLERFVDDEHWAGVAVVFLVALSHLPDNLGKNINM